MEGVASVALAVDNPGHCFGALQYRYFGPRLLVEDNFVRSASTATLNGRVGYKISPAARVELEGFNLTTGVHFHPIESRTFRVSLAVHF